MRRRFLGVDERVVIIAAGVSCTQLIFPVERLPRAPVQSGVGGVGLAEPSSPNNSQPDWLAPSVELRPQPRRNFRSDIGLRPLELVSDQLGNVEVGECQLELGYFHDL
jgi:hypothetical protein